MKNQKFNISQFYPCEEALKFYEKYSSFEKAWQKCKRGDWLLWIVDKILEKDNRRLILTRGYCVKPIIHLLKDKRSIRAVNAAIEYGKGKISKEKLDDAVENAHIASAKYNSSAYYAVDSVSNSFYGNPVTFATDTFRSVDAKKKYQKQTVDLCRKYLTKEVFKRIKNQKL